MHTQESITQWIDRVRRGDQQAAALLWDRYFTRLVHLAQGMLRGVRRAAADEEDVVLSAFHSFYRAVQAGRLPDLKDRDDLWRLLLCLTERKAIDQRRHELAQKRGAGAVVSASCLESDLGDGAGGQGLAGLAAPEPTPEFTLLIAEELERLLGLLDDDTLRSVAVLKLEGFANEDIARQLGCALRTVERKLGIIRTSWQREVAA
jgi:DNA-directed RNA polymerase specialized sigma24 family protein